MLTTSFSYREGSSTCSGVDAVWTLGVSRAATGPLPYLALPDGCIDLIYRRTMDPSGALTAATLIVAGPAERAATYFPAAGEEFAGVRFAPGWGGAALGLEAAALTGAVVRAGELSAQLARLEDELSGCSSVGQVAALLQANAELWASKRSPRSGTRKAIDLLRISGGQIPVKRAAELAGVSPRTLHRNVLEAAGVSPKSLLRVFRFRRALSCLHGHTGTSLSELALRAGYADQAHMSREFRALGGFSPGCEVFYAGRSARDGEAPL